MWKGLGTELGVDLDVKQSGGIVVATTPDHMRSITAKAEIERGFGVPIEILDRTALRDIAPYLTEDAIGGGFCPVEGKANPLRATPPSPPQPCGQVPGSRPIRVSPPSNATAAPSACRPPAAP